MKEIFKWLVDNESLVLDFIRFGLSVGAFIYATVIHLKSKKRITTLETKEEIKEELIDSIKQLQEALERSKDES